MEEEEDDDHFSSMVPHPNFQRFMSYTRFKDFRCLLLMIWCDDKRKENGDEWWKFSCIVFKIFCLLSFQRMSMKFDRRYYMQKGEKLQMKICQLGAQGLRPLVPLELQCQ
jgi:hypothetical protein